MMVIQTLKSIAFSLRHFKNIKFFTWKESLFTWKESFKFSLNLVNIDGLFLEFGVWKGASIIEISSIVPNKVIYGFDSFDGLPEDWCNEKKGYLKVDNVQEVLNSLPNNVHIIVGLFQNTLEPFLKTHKEKVAFIHLDADLYSSTKYVLNTLAKNKRFQNGTIIQFDEFLSINFYSTEMSAFKDFVKEYGIKYDVIMINRGRVAVRIKE